MPRAPQQVKPKRSIEVVRRALPQPDDEVDASELFDADLLRAIEQVEGVQDASVRIFRQGLHGRDLTYIDDVPPANFNLTMLKHPPYNGGKFRVLVCDADGTFMKNSLLQIEPAPKAPEPPAAPPAPPAPPPNNNAEAFVLLAKAMTDGFSRLGELIVANRAVPTPPRSTEQILSELTMMKSLFDRPQSNDPIDTITKLLGLVKELPGRDGGAETGPMDVLLELTKQFIPKMMEAQAATAGAPPARPALPQRPVPTGAPRPAVVVPTGEGKPDVNIIITQQLKLLVRAAESQSDPEAYAVVVLDTVPPPVLDSFLQRPDWFEEICRYAPAAQPHKEWFTELKACIDDYLTDDEPPAQTTGDNNDGGAPDGTAATGNGKPDTPNP